MAQDRNVVAAGRRVVPEADGQDQRFVDFFSIADDGMVRGCTRYHHLPPRDPRRTVIRPSPWATGTRPPPGMSVERFVLG